MKLDQASRYEVHIDTSDCPQESREEYENMMVLALARFGYSPYLAIDGGLAFAVGADRLTEIKECD